MRPATPSTPVVRALNATTVSVRYFSAADVCSCTLSSGLQGSSPITRTLCETSKLLPSFRKAVDLTCSPLISTGVILAPVLRGFHEKGSANRFLQKLWFGSHLLILLPIYSLAGVHTSAAKARSGTTIKTAAVASMQLCEKLTAAEVQPVACFSMTSRV